MNQRSVLPLALLASVFATSALGQAAATATAPTEEEINYTLPTDEWYVPKSTLSFGVRVLSKGANVKFRNLGSVNQVVEGVRSGGDRAYSDGYVGADAVRVGIEPITPPGDMQQPGDAPGSFFQYTVDAGDYYQVRRITRLEPGEGQTVGGTSDEAVGLGLKYVEGRTREWGVASTDQIENGRVRMSNYWATSQGASVEEEEGMNAGVELALARRFGNFGRRFEWGITAGVAMNTINAKTGGTVQSTLMRRSDYYTIFGTLPEGAAGGPTFDHYSENPNPDNVNRETTAPIGTTPVEEGVVTVAGNIDVRGNWQIKGAYFLLRVGPSIRAQLTERWGMNASAGVAGAYSGTRYSVTEQLTIPDLDSVIIDERWDADSKLLAGFYADVNVDWAATDRTGLFAGVSMQQFGSYNMSVAGRTAKIDLGNAVGLRGGINIKF